MPDTSKPKVLIVGAFPSSQKKRIYGGQVSVCARLLESDFVATHAVRTIDTTQISNPPPPFLVRAVFAIKRVIVFGADLVFHQPDVAIVFVALGASVYEKGLMIRLSALLGIPVMVFPRAGGLIRGYFDSEFFARVVRQTLGRADLFLCQGRTFQDFAINELGFDMAHAPIIPNWTASQDHLQIGESRIYERADPGARILFLGWIEEFKGVFELLESARRLKKAGISFHLTLAGEGSALPQAKEFVALHDLHGNITFAGWVNDAAKSALLRANDILALPSWSEGLPNSMIEAMTAGLASVVTDVGMISDYLVDGRDALIVPPRDVSRLTSALRSLIEVPAFRETIAKNGCGLASTQFSLENGVRLLSEAVSLTKDNARPLP